MTTAPPTACDVAIVGAGIVGLAVAREIGRRAPGRRVAVLEREEEIGRFQTGRNSGVVHAGIYYTPGSLKAQLCVEGARELYAFCDARGIAYERCGKVIVATEPCELPRLNELERRGRANRVPELRRLDRYELGAVEPHATGIAALHSPHTGIVDFAGVARAYSEDVTQAGGTVNLGCGVTAIEERARSVVLHHSQGSLEAERVVFCAGEAADRMAVQGGADADPRIVPFRGTYLRLRPERRHLVRGMIYPVPDPALPFLGVHLNRHMRGEVLVGPTALLVPHARSLAWPGTWRVMRRYWRTGLTEIHHRLSVRAVVRAAARFVPEIQPEDVRPAFSGDRAQAVSRDGKLLDDFVFAESSRTLHVRNAPSPAATSSLAIARHVADRALG